MKTIRIFLFLFLAVGAKATFAQDSPAEVVAVKSDNADKLATIINKDNINNCYTEGPAGYSLLSYAVRAGSIKCFNLLIAKGADVNKICNGYVPPLMHAAKYGRLEMVKILVAKGANVNYTYDGTILILKGQTALTYAQQFNRTEIVDYLKTVITK